MRRALLPTVPEIRALPLGANTKFARELLGDGAVARAGQDGEGDHRPVTLFDVRCARHGSQRLADIVQRRDQPFAARARDPAVLF